MAQANPLKERDLLNWIIAAAEATGWRCYHVPAPMTAGRDGKWHGSPRAKGLPDLFLLHDDPPRMIVAEVKGDGGKLSEAQQEFLRLARNVADSLIEDRLTYPVRQIGVYAWTPAEQDIIERILKSKTLL